MRIVFMGSPEFSVPAFDALVQAGHEIVAVYTQPPRPAGRGKSKRPTAVHKRAQELEIMVRHPERFATPDAVADFRALDADIAVVVAYGLILPRPILDAFPLGCVNIHASLLPRWRGAAPIHRAIMAGDKQTGICIMRMETGLDTGPVYLRKICNIAANETTGELHDRLAILGAEAVVDVLERIDQLTPVMQSASGVSYAKKIDKAEARIDWRAPAAEVHRVIRALSPAPGAWALFSNERVKLLGARVVDMPLRIGEIWQDEVRLCIGCGQGAVEITQLQRAGKRPAATSEILRGWRPSTFVDGV